MLYEYKLGEKIHNLKKEKEEKPQLDLQLHLNTPVCIWGVGVVIKAGRSPYLLYQATVVMCLITSIIIQIINITVISLQSCESQSEEKQGSVETRQEKKPPHLH